MLGRGLPGRSRATGARGLAGGAAGEALGRASAGGREGERGRGLASARTRLGRGVARAGAVLGPARRGSAATDPVGRGPSQRARRDLGRHRRPGRSQGGGAGRGRGWTPPAADRSARHGQEHAGPRTRRPAAGPRRANRAGGLVHPLRSGPSGEARHAATAAPRSPLLGDGGRDGGRRGAFLDPAR